MDQVITPHFPAGLTVLESYGQMRHAAGLALLALSCPPYFIAEFMLIMGYTAPGHIRVIVAMLLASDGMFIAGLFVLGEAFWERLKKLFA